MTTKKRTGGSRQGRTATSTVGVVRIPPSGVGNVLVETIDSTDVSRHLEMEGGRYFRHFEGIKTDQDFILAADVDQGGNFRLREVAGFLKQIGESTKSLSESGSHFESASLFPLQALRRSGESLEPVVLAERAREQRRLALTIQLKEYEDLLMVPGVRQEPEQGERAEKAGAIPSLDTSGPAIERSPIARAEESFALSDLLNDQSRHAFAAGLAHLANQPLCTDELRISVERIKLKCEDTFSVLREPTGLLVTLRFDEESGQAELVPLNTPKAVIRYAGLPALEVTPVESLSDREASIALGRFSGRRAAGRISDEQRAEWGRMAASKMTPDQLKDRASKGGKVVAASLTPEQRSEKARKAALAKHAKLRASKQEE